MFSRQRGFTMMELLIVMTIIGILSAIAIPWYSNYSLRVNRAAGKSALLAVLARQESFYVDRKAYATVLGALSVPADTATTWYVTRDAQMVTADSGDAIYAITLAAYSAASIGNCSVAGAATAGAFAVLATPVNAQAKDAACMKLCVGSAGDRGASGTDGSAGCWRS